MKQTTPSTPVSVGRREVLVGIGALAGAMAVGLPEFPANATVATPAAVTPSAAFLNAARLATGESAIDPVLAVRVYEGVRALHPDIDARAAAVADALGRLGGDASSLLHGEAGLAGFFTDLMSGLYLGTVGPKASRRCVAFETIESYRVVADVLRPPSYCSGEPLYWAQPVPGTF